MKTEKIVHRLSAELYKFSFNRYSVGYQYLASAIYLVASQKKYIKSLRKTIYPIIARKYDTGPDNVAWCIAKTLESMYARTDKQIIQDYFCLYEEEGLPSPKTFVMCVAQNILDDEDVDCIFY